MRLLRPGCCFQGSPPTRGAACEEGTHWGVWGRRCQRRNGGIGCGTIGLQRCQHPVSDQAMRPERAGSPRTLLDINAVLHAVDISHRRGPPAQSASRLNTRGRPRRPAAQLAPLRSPALLTPHLCVFHAAAMADSTLLPAHALPSSQG